MQQPKAPVQFQKDFEPFIKADQKVPEFTRAALILGVILAIIFGLANAYLGLKVGMTVSASIPAAVISMAILRGVLKRGTILENNISQTIGSSGESLAAGVIFTIPAFLIWGIQIPIWKIIIISILGGFLGILFMIPLRRYLIVQEHKTLPYPEGTACAEILMAGDEGGSKAKTVFAGIGLGAIYKFIVSGLKLGIDRPVWDLRFFKGASVGIEASPALLGVGFIIGPRIASLMLAGAIMGYLGIAPLIAFLGNFITMPVHPATIPISELTPAQLRSNYIVYIGAGAVTFGGFVSLIKAFPVIFSSFKLGFQEVLHGLRGGQRNLERTALDIPMSVVLLGSLLVAVIIWLLPGTHLGFIGALLTVIFGFFFVSVAARIVGIVGSSSSPVSGMTLATLLVTTLVFVALGMPGKIGESATMIAAMMVGSIVCIAVCMSGDASQDLKTGFLVGSTPRKQQIAEFVGVLAPAFFMGWIVILLHSNFGLGPGGRFEAPQATIMSLVVKGVITQALPWVFVFVGMLLALSIELLGVSSLPVAIGMYLPVALSTPIFVGGMVYWYFQKKSSADGFKKQEDKGILYGSGLVAGDALVGVAIVLVLSILGALGSPLEGKWQSWSEGWWLRDWFGVSAGSLHGVTQISTIIVFAIVVWFLYRNVKRA